MSQQQAHDRIAEHLAKGEHQITFRKKDGTVRHMRATRDPALIPEDCLTHNEPGKEQKPVDYRFVKVIDLDIGQWRQFAFDSLITPSLESLGIEQA